MELLRKLCNAPGISGFESEVTDLMKKELAKSADKVFEDNFGNVISQKGKGKTRIMLTAHMDEIGLMVKHISKEGFLSFIKIGGIDDRILSNQRVIIGGSKCDVVGIIGSKPPHLQKDEERKKIIRYDELFIDIGVSSDKQASKLVAVGDPITFEPNFGSLGKNVYYGKALDDRLGCYIMIEIMRKLPKNINATVYAVGTVQEEVGLKGARVSAYRLNPDYAIALDTTIAGGTPNVKETESNLKFGKGPAITIIEAGGRGVVTHPTVKKILIDAASKNKIPHQMDVLEGGMTDAAMIYLTREGIPSGSVSIPVRYIHSPTGVFDIRDVENTIKLLGKCITKFK